MSYLPPLDVAILPSWEASLQHLDFWGHSRSELSSLALPTPAVTCYALVLVTPGTVTSIPDEQWNRGRPIQLTGPEAGAPRPESEVIFDTANEIH